MVQKYRCPKCEFIITKKIHYPEGLTKEQKKAYDLAHAMIGDPMVKCPKCGAQFFETDTKQWFEY